MDRLDACVNGLVGGDALLATASAQTLVLQCRGGRVGDVAATIHRRAGVIERVLEWAVEGERLCFVFVALLKYLACHELTLRQLLADDLCGAAVAACMGLLLAQDPLVTHEVVAFLGALTANPAAARLVAPHMSAYPPLLKAFLTACTTPTTATADVPAALALVAIFVSTADGCAAAKPHFTRIQDVLAAVRRVKGCRRAAADVTMYLQCVVP